MVNVARPSIFLALSVLINGLILNFHEFVFFSKGISFDKTNIIFYAINEFMKGVLIYLLYK